EDLEAIDVGDFLDISKEKDDFLPEPTHSPTLNESDSDEAATSSVPEDEGHKVADAMDTTGDLSDSNSLVLEDQSCEAVDTVSTREESSDSNSLVDSKATTKHDFHISAVNFEAFMMVFRQKKQVEQHAVATAQSI
ncbi:hypothetical protein M422DRAFT_243372, partial [Sphaerobolus stellatus SS14]